MKKILLILGIVAGLWSQRADAKFLADVATDVVQVPHLGATTGGWLTDEMNWLTDRVTDLDKLSELVTNNVLTRAIRAFNELQTALQTDISDVLGTIQTLAEAPTEFLGDLVQIPSSIMEMFSGAMGGLGDFQNIYTSAMSTFSAIGNAQSLGKNMGDFSGLFGSGKRWNSAYDFQNSYSGLRTALNADFLSSSQRSQRERALRRLTSKAAYGQDQAQVMSMQTDLLNMVVRNQNRDAEMRAMDVGQEAADRMAIQAQLQARAASRWLAAEQYIW